jgi:hypothetical protein
LCLHAPMLKAPHTPEQIATTSSAKVDRHAPTRRLLGGQLAVASPELLDEAVPGDDHPGTAVLVEPAHWSQPRLETAMVGLDPVVGVPLGAVPRRWEQLLQHQRIGRCSVGDDLHRHHLRRADGPRHCGEQEKDRRSSDRAKERLRRRQCACTKPDGRCAHLTLGRPGRRGVVASARTSDEAGDHRDDLLARRLRCGADPDLLAAPEHADSVGESEHLVE